MTARLRIDFVSDVTCPWCAIGLAGLERAIARLDGEVPVELRFQPFELNPGLPREGVALADYAWHKYGADADELARRQTLIRGRGAEAGLALAERTHVYNTFDAHRLLHWAGLEGRQHALKSALLEAYHVRRENPALPEVLVAAAAAAGLDAQRALEVIERGDIRRRGARGSAALAGAGYRRCAGDGDRRALADPGRPECRCDRADAAANCCRAGAGKGRRLGPLA